MSEERYYDEALGQWVMGKRVEPWGLQEPAEPDPDLPYHHDRYVPKAARPLADSEVDPEWVASLEREYGVDLSE